MPDAVRWVSFTVTADAISPAVPQWAGVQGEHRATGVSFEVPEEWIDAGYRFRVEWVDGMQAFFVSDYLEVEDGRVKCLLPAAWTAAGGTAEIRLAAGWVGETPEACQTVYSAAGRLSFTGRDEKQPTRAQAESSIAYLLENLKTAADKVQIQVDDEGGSIRFANKIALVYGCAPATAGAEMTVTFPCTFSVVHTVYVTGDEGALPLTRRTYNSFTICPDKSYYRVSWIVVGTLTE